MRESPIGAAAIKGKAAGDAPSWATLSGVHGRGHRPREAKNKIKMGKTRQCQVLTMAAVRRHEGGRPRGPWAAELEGHGGWARGRTRARKWPGFSFTSRWPDLDLGFIAPFAAMGKSGGEIPRIEAE